MSHTAALRAEHIVFQDRGVGNHGYIMLTRL